MRQLLPLIFSLLCLNSFSQASDTTIYKVVEELPRFPGCETLDTTLAVKNQCAQTALIVFFNRNIVYPMQARQDSIAGTVVLSFVVEKDGYISNPTLVKDIGGGCGEEALRVASGMNEALKTASLTWVPGKKSGVPVRTHVNVPIKFKLQEPPDFVLVGWDTVYVEVDDSLTFKAGNAALEKHLIEKLKFPAAFKDSCKIGSMDMTLLVNPDGLVKVLDMSDYGNLGFDFQFEAIQAATSTYGMWNPATRKGRQVPASYELTVLFKPTATGCQQKIADYDRANALAVEGSQLFNEEKQEEGLAKLNEALKLFPDNANFLYLRGQAYMNMNKMTEACEDFKKVRSIVSLEIVNQLIPLLCK
ncbi:MAG: energy transducer TonB [Bacteroidota bacterium]